MTRKLWCHLDAYFASPYAMETLRLIASLSLRSSLDAVPPEDRYSLVGVEMQAQAMGMFYHLAGRNQFVLGEAMQRLLSLTSLDGIGLRDVRMPYRCIWIAIASPSLWFPSPGGAPVALRGMYLCDDPEGIVGTAWLSADGSEPEDGLLLPFGFDPGAWNGESLEESLASFSDGVIAYSVSGDGPVPCPEGALQGVNRVAFNLLVYLTSGEVEAEHEVVPELPELIKEHARARAPWRRQRLEERLAEAGHAVTWLGRSVEREWERRLGELHGTVRAHWVRGHWRRIPTESDPRRKTWVRPHTRGGVPHPDSSREYRFRGEGEAP